MQSTRKSARIVIRSKSIAPTAVRGRNSTGANLRKSVSTFSVIQTIEGSVASKTGAAGRKRPATSESPPEEVGNSKARNSYNTVASKRSKSHAPVAKRGHKSTPSVLSSSPSDSSAIQIYVGGAVFSGATGSKSFVTTSSQPEELATMKDSISDNTIARKSARIRSESVARAAPGGRQSTAAVLSIPPENPSAVQTNFGNVDSMPRVTGSNRPTTTSCPAEKLASQKIYKSDVAVVESGETRFQSASVAPAATQGQIPTVAVPCKSSTSFQAIESSAKTAVVKKKAAGEKSSSSTPHPIDSASRTMSLSPVPGSSRGLWNDDPYDFPDVLDVDDITFLYSLEDVPVHNSLRGDAYLQDEEVVSEDASSSLVNANSGNSVSARTTDVRSNGRQQGLKERVVKYMASFNPCNIL